MRVKKAYLDTQPNGLGGWLNAHKGWFGILAYAAALEGLILATFRATPHSAVEDANLFVGWLILIVTSIIVAAVKS